MTVKQVSHDKQIFKSSFSNVIAAGVDVNDFNLIRTGAGQGVSQSAGNLVLTSGTTANSETILRSQKAFRGNLDLRYLAILSQRIVNNNFFIELVDLILNGADLAFSCPSAVLLTVTFPDSGSNPFYDAAIPNKSVGQSVYLGNFRSTATNVLTPGRYTIASLTVTTVTFTVAGFTSGATGTVQLFGWNYHHVLYDGTTATAAKYDSQRNGWATGDTTMTINTTASPGHVGILSVQDGNSSYQDQLAASNTALQSTIRASRTTTLPDFDVPMFLQIRSANGSTAPASTTTFTIGFVAIEEMTVTSVALNGVRPQAYQSALPVQIVGTLQPDWSYAAAALGIVNVVTAVTIKAAAGVGIRNYIRSIQVMAEALTTATELAIRDGAGGTVLWRTKIPVGGLPSTNFTFDTPLKGTANTLLEVVTLTASGAGAVYFNAQGFTGP